MTARRALADWPMALALTALVSLGLVLVYSSSAVYAGRNFHDPQRFLKSQLMWAAFGFVALVATLRVSGPVLRRLAPAGLVLAAVGCAAVLLPGVGRKVGGARRWLAFGPLTCQPSEFAKLALVVALAAALARRADREGTRQGLLWPVLLMQVPVGLVVCEPDLGTAVVMEMLCVGMLVAAGLRLRTLAALGVLASPLLYHLTFGTPFRLKRLMSYLDPWAYRATTGYQVTEALISIGSGGLFGVGLGDGKQKLFFLPEAHTDFIFAILAEELGLCGVMVLLAALATLVFYGLSFACRAPDPFDRYLALGLALLVGVPALLNVAVATGLLPTKGLPLPFVSYGGSNLLVTLAAMGMLFRIGRAKEGAAGQEDKRWT